MTPAQAIRAATSSAADLIGRNDLGTIQPGMLADMIAVKGDPLKNIRLLENVQWVMKGGTIIKSQPATSSK
jgi:imidazolonepropionase-like amidohydrolase